MISPYHPEYVPSVMKMINGSNSSRGYMTDVSNYITDDSKTYNKEWVGSSGCSPDHPADDMYLVKKMYHKTHGKQGEHFVLSPSPDRPYIDNHAYMDMAREIALQYSEYQCVFALHLDSYKRHLHFLLNSVSYKTGKKFSQSPSDLNRKKAAINDILMKYGFELIMASAEELYDETDHSNGSGCLDYLEIHPPRYRIPNMLEKYVREEMITYSYEPLFEFKDYRNESEENTMDKANQSCHDTNLPVSAGNNPFLPVSAGNNPLGIASNSPLVIQPQVNIHTGSYHNMEQLREEMHYQQFATAQLGLEMYNQLRQNGCDEPICIRPTISLFFDNGQSEDNATDNVVEVTLNNVD